MMIDVNDYIEIYKRMKKHEATSSTPVGDFVFEMDDYGNFRIGHVPSAIYSGWVPYRSIARMKYGGDIYIGVSAYYEGDIPHETVLKLEQVR